MKKKLFKSLMLLVAAVSMGAFVSCKDTNEDLYNELRTQYIQENATLQDALQKQIDALKAQIATDESALNALKDALAGIRTCSCDEDAIKALINGLKDQIAGINTQIATLTSALENAATKDQVSAINATIAGLNTQLDNVNTALGTLQGQYSTLQSEFSAYKTAQDILAQVVADLKEELENINQCNCDYDAVTKKLVELEERLKAAETQAKAAYDLATTANTNATTALTTANEAKLTAQQAKDAADAAVTAANAATAAANQAVTTAAVAEEAAKNAGLTAQEAKDLANEAKETANTALQTANAANAVATTALTTAQAALELANANKTEIETLKQRATNIEENAKNLADLIKTNAENIAQNARDIADTKVDVQKNADDIIQNAKDIAENAAKISTNADNIAKNAEDIANINTQLTTMSRDIQDAITKATDAYALASTNSGLISSLTTSVENLKTQIAGQDAANELRFKGLEDITKTLSENLTTLSQTVGDNTSDISSLKTEIANMKETAAATNQIVDKLISKIDSLSKEVTDLKVELEKVKGECATNLETAKLYAQEQIAAAKTEWMNEVKTLLEDYAKKGDIPDISNLATKEDLQNAYNELKALIPEIPDVSNFVTKEQLQSAIESAYNALVAKLMEEVGKDRAAISRDSTDIAWLKEQLTKVENKFDNYYDKDYIDLLLDRIKALEGKVDGGLKEEIISELTTKLNEKITELKTEINSELPGTIESILSTKNYITEADVMPIVNAAIAGAGVDDIKNIVELVTKVHTLESTTVKISDYEVDKNAIWEQINTNTNNISDLTTRVQNIEVKLPGMESDIEDLKTRMTEAETKLTELTNKIEDLQKDVEALQEELAKQVTSIIIQGTYNPMFGSFNLPAGIQSNMLLAFYGLPINAIEFPTSDVSYYTQNTATKLTDDDMNMINGVEIFTHHANLPLLNEEGTAGKIYMTINPNTADLTGLQLSIVNTQDKESPIKLQPITKSNEKLQFGYTRADNGFYEAVATVTAKTVKEEDNGLALTRDDMTALFHEVKNQIVQIARNFATSGTQTDLEKLTTEVYNVLTKMKVDRQGLKCVYTTTDATGATKEHSVYSEYNLAATFFNPLNLDWGKDFDYQYMPGYDVISDLLNRIENTLTSHVDIFVKEGVNTEKLKDLVASFKSDEITYKGQAEGLIQSFEDRVSKEITIDGVSYTLQVPVSGAVYVKFDKNLTAGGSAVAVPAEVAYDENAINIEHATIVIGGDITDGMNIKFVIPAKDGKGIVSAYASIQLVDSSAKAELVGGVIRVTTSDQEGTIETHNVASYAAGNLTVTGYEGSFAMKNIIGTDGSINLPIVLDITENVRDLLNKEEITMNKVVNELNTYLDHVNNYKYTVNGWISSFIDEYLRKYLNQINSDVTYFFNSINRRFGPFMVAANNGKGFKRLSTTKSHPTELSATDLKFFPTSKTLELFVPLARKHVAVTNVFKGSASAQGGNADCKSALEAANTGKLNTVVDGTTRSLTVTGLQSGYVYEVAYSVLDFEGNVATDKYYVTVK